MDVGYHGLGNEMMDYEYRKGIHTYIYIYILGDIYIFVISYKCDAYWVFFIPFNYNFNCVNIR